MDKDYVLTGNKLIADFMSGQLVKTHHNQYHTSWNELMSVVEKIESLNFSVYIKTRGTTIQDEDEKLVSFSFKNEKLKIEHCYKAVIEFIKWYNNENR